MRARGATSTAIAARLGVAPSTVRGWLSDPEGSGSRARKRRYGACCWSCGRATTGNEPGQARALCPTCRARIRRRWTPALVVQRMREWQARYGTWPTASDWHSSRAHDRGGEAQRRWEEGIWPPASTVTRLFRRFDYAVRAAMERPDEDRR